MGIPKSCPAAKPYCSRCNPDVGPDVDKASIEVVSLADRRRKTLVREAPLPTIWPRQVGQAIWCTATGERCSPSHLT